jgi:hypothetical protein
LYSDNNDNQQSSEQFNTQYNQQELNDLIANKIVYPEIFYKIQPFVMVYCDQMDGYGDKIPPQEVIDQMTEMIHNDVCRIYPDIAEYAREYDRTNTDSEIVDAINGFFGGRRFRRRGLLRDIIGILLISELFRRRRRY